MLTEYYGINDVANKLNCTKRTIYNLIERGELRAVKVGSRWKFSQKEIEDYLQRINPDYNHRFSLKEVLGMMENESKVRITLPNEDELFLGSVALLRAEKFNLLDGKVKNISSQESTMNIQIITTENDNDNFV